MSKSLTSWIVLLAFGALMIYAEGPFTDRAAPRGPIHDHVVPYYLDHSYPDAHTPNAVTTILADYRGYDTMGETTVIFTAGMACMLILGMARR